MLCEIEIFLRNIPHIQTGYDFDKWFSSHWHFHLHTYVLINDFLYWYYVNWPSCNIKVRCAPHNNHSYFLIYKQIDASISSMLWAMPCPQRMKGHLIDITQLCLSSLLQSVLLPWPPLRVFDACPSYHAFVWNSPHDPLIDTSHVILLYRHQFNLNFQPISLHVVNIFMIKYSHSQLHKINFMNIITLSTKNGTLYIWLP